MAIQITHVTEADFPELIRCMWFTHENPLQDLFRIFCPVNAVGCSTHEESVQESIERFWEWQASDPSSIWLKAVDEQGKIVGGALWKLNETNPYEHAEEEEAYWHPPGGQREFANQVLAKYEDARSRLATRPHVYLNILFTHPDYERQGIGSQLLTWGINKAKEMDVEMWLNAWKYGRKLYERMGFVTVSHHVAQPKTSDPDAAWLKCEKELVDLEEWVMWRPKTGPYVEGQSVKPWEVET